MKVTKYHGDFDQGVYLDQAIENLLLHRFGIDRHGTFVDVGAYDPVHLSNSYYFETEKDFLVICVEANPIMAERLRRKRKVVIEAAAANECSPRAPFQIVLGHPRETDFAGSGMHTYEGVRSETTTKTAKAIFDIRVAAITLDAILESCGVKEIDVLSIDVEGHEKQVLEGFTLERYKPKVLCIENYFQETWLAAALPGYEFTMRLHYDDFFARSK